MVDINKAPNTIEPDSNVTLLFFMFQIIQEKIVNSTGETTYVNYIKGRFLGKVIIYSL